MKKQFAKDRVSQVDAMQQRKDMYNSVPFTVLLFIALGASLKYQPDQPINSWGYLWIVASSLALLALIWSVVASYRQADELQKLIRLQATSLSFIAVITAVFAAELLHMAHWVNAAALLQSIFIGGLIFWNIALEVLNRQSRS